MAQSFIDHCLARMNPFPFSSHRQMSFVKLNDVYTTQRNLVFKLNLSSCYIELDGDSFTFKKIEKLLIKFSQWHLFVQIWWHTHCIIYHYSCDTSTLSIPSKSELQNSLLKFEHTTYSAIYSIDEIVLKILQWLNFDWINKSRFSLNLESSKLWVAFKGKYGKRINSLLLGIPWTCFD